MARRRVLRWRYELRRLRWRVRSRVQAYVGRDATTGLGTRAQGLRLLKRDLAGGRAGAVIICDLDNMYAFNHANTHVLGDELLRLVAAVLTSRTSRGWAEPFGRGAYRLGGDEFLIRLPDMDEATAVSLAEDAREKLKRLPDALGAATTEGRAFGGRFGVAAWRAGAAPPFGTLMRAVDELMHDKHDTVEVVSTARLDGIADSPV